MGEADGGGARRPPGQVTGRKTACAVVQRTESRSCPPHSSGLVPLVDPEVVALLASVREVAAVALVSNATTRLELDLDRQGLSGVADAVVNTARIGVAKPDPRVYRIAAERVGTVAGRCLFVDDTEANVAAARREGMAALHYRRPADLRAVLAPLLLDGAGSRAPQT